MLLSIFSPENFEFTSSIQHLCVSFLLNAVVVWIIVHFFYYPKGKRRDYYFTFLLLSMSIFMLIYLLMGNAAEVGVGAALGLFAIFGIIRYRTESVPIREMTYLFFLVALSVLNGKVDDINLLGRLIINALFILAVWASENLLSVHKIGCKYVKYDNISLITPDRYTELVADLEKRLGLKIVRVAVGSVDFLKDMAMLRVYYLDPEHHIKSIDRVMNIPKDQQFD